MNKDRKLNSKEYSQQVHLLLFSLCCLGQALPGNENQNGYQKLVCRPHEERYSVHSDRGTKTSSYLYRSTTSEQE